MAIKRGEMFAGYGCRKRGTKGHFKSVRAGVVRVMTDAVDSDAFIRTSEQAHPLFEFRVTLRAIHVTIGKEIIR